MTANEIVLRVVQALQHVDVPYMLAGSYSSNAYGVARATQDADFVIQLDPAKLDELKRELGGAFRMDPQLSFETVTGTYRCIFQETTSHFKIELFLLSDDPHDCERFGRRHEEQYLGGRVFLPTAEDIVVTKLRWSLHGRRRKDVDDVRGLIGVQRDRLDWPYIERWCDQHGTRALLDEIRRSLPPETPP